jgi:hypothetical protein
MFEKNSWFQNLILNCHRLEVLFHKAEEEEEEEEEEEDDDDDVREGV